MANTNVANTGLTLSRVSANSGQEWSVLGGNSRQVDDGNEKRGEVLELLDADGRLRTQPRVSACFDCSAEGLRVSACNAPFLFALQDVR